MPPEIPASFSTAVIATTLTFAASILAMVSIAALRRLPRISALAFSSATAAILALWFASVLLPGKTGFFVSNPLLAPNLMLMFLALFIILQRVYASRLARTVFDAIPSHWIIGLQAYRVVGWGFLVLYKMNLLPAAFAIPAGFGDILVGITAPFVAYACAKKQAHANKLAIAWNIIGIADLILALSIGILAFPRPLQVLPLQVSTEQMSLYPLVMISCFAVPLALLLHAFSLRSMITARDDKK